MADQELSGSQRAFLRREAHDLKPFITVGKEGITSSLKQALDEALTLHELVKLRFYSHKDQKQEDSRELAAALGAQIVGLIGNNVLLFRESSDPLRRQFHIR